MFQEIPAQVFEKTFLERFAFYRNQLVSLPPQIKNLVHLTSIDLSYNKLASIPPGTMIYDVTCRNLRTSSPVVFTTRRKQNRIFPKRLRICKTFFIRNLKPQSKSTSIFSRRNNKSTKLDFIRFKQKSHRTHFRGNP